jgi:hypothetical protein
MQFFLLIAVAVLGLPQRGASAKCRMKSPDVSISGLRLADATSAAQVVGAGANLSESEDDLPHARFTNSNGAQELVLYAHYGADPDEYAEAEVGISGAEAMTLKDLPVDTFKSGRGVELGMSVKEVEDLFGSCLKSRQKSGDELLLEYEIGKADQDDELKTFGYPVYYAEYEFKGGKLVRFRFGFAYP